MVSIPDKSMVCASLLPSEYGTIGEPNRVVCEDLPVMDIFRILPMNASDYFRTDSHMNFVGGQKVAHAILRRLYRDAEWVEAFLRTNGRGTASPRSYIP